MSELFAQLSVVLTSEIGSLTYHLVLAFSIMGALLGVLSHLRTSLPTYVRRLSFGLALLLTMRLAMFVVAGLTWQGVIDPLIVPLFERGVTLLSLVVIVWLWVFLEPSRFADAAAILLGMVLLSVITFGALWWSNQQVESGFNGSIPDQVSEITALLLITFGLLLLLVRQPPGWVFGILMLLMEGLGHMFYLLSPTQVGDYPAIVRLAQMAAYPLLFLLPQRLPQIEGSPLPMVTVQEDRSLAVEALDPESIHRDALAAYLELASQATPANACQIASHVIADYMEADICMLANSLEGGESIQIQCGFDRIVDYAFLGRPISKRLFPIIVNGLEAHQSVHLTLRDNSEELAAFANLFGMDNSGNLLAIPLTRGVEDSFIAVILYSPHTGVDWSDDDQEHLLAFCNPLAYFLQHYQQLDQMQNQVTKIEAELGVSQSNNRQVEMDRRQLQNLLGVIHLKAEQEKILIESLHQAIESEDDLHALLSQLADGNAELRHTTQIAVESENDRWVLEGADDE